jgi:1-acyl-sn-glycerol-3-phosphate acyltransferase
MATVAAAVSLCGRPAARTSTAAVDRTVRAWASAWLRAAGARVTVTGAENIDPTLAYTVVSNHQSNLDSMVLLASLPLSLRFLAKTEMFRTPVLGQVMRAAGMIEVDRAAPDARQIDTAAARCVKAGQSLGVFPEGTTSPDGRVRGFKNGAFVLAIANQTPVLPVAIEGSGRVWPAGRTSIRAGRVRVAVGQPVPVAGLTRDDVRQLRGIVRDAVLLAHHDLTAGDLTAGDLAAGDLAAGQARR